MDERRDVTSVTRGGQGRSRFLIVFGARAMDHIAQADMPAVARAAHAVVQETLNAGVYVAAGETVDNRAQIVAPDGTITPGPYPDVLSGFPLIEVPSRQDAVYWASRMALACRCPQQVWEIADDPELTEMVEQAKPPTTS